MTISTHIRTGVVLVGLLAAGALQGCTIQGGHGFRWATRAPATPAPTAPPVPAFAFPAVRQRPAGKADGSAVYVFAGAGHTDTGADAGGAPPTPDGGLLPESLPEPDSPYWAGGPAE